MENKTENKSEAQIANDMKWEDYETDGTILEQGAQNGGMLAVDSGQNQQGVRSNRGREKEASSCTSPLVSPLQGSDTGKTSGLPQMRQPSVREPGTPLSGDAQGQRGRQNTEGPTPLSEEDALPGRTSAERSESGSAKESTSVSNLREHETARATSNLPATTQPRPTALQAKDNGVLVGSTLEEEFRLATAYHRSGLMPRGLNSPEKILVALQICRELGLPPMSSVGKIAVINGTPSLFGDLPLSLVMKSGLLESIKEVFFHNEDLSPKYAECTLKRTGFDPIVRDFSVEDAKRAGLWGKDVWKSYPKRMLQMRARSWALKDMFPDILSGIGIIEWDGDAVGTAPSSSLADELNKAYLTDGKVQAQGSQPTQIN
jgi:hypothetical protein